MRYKVPPPVVETDETLNLLDDLVARARRRGADAADAVLATGVSLSVAQRLGAPEHLERSEGSDLGLRVLIGRRQAIASSSDLSRGSLDELVERALAMASVVPEDSYCGLAAPDEIFKGPLRDPDICDPVEVGAGQLTERARICEEAARAVAGITNSEGAEASYSLSSIALLASNGFAGSYGISRHGVGVSVLAGEGTAMERDYDFSSTVFLEDMEDPAEIGRRAGELTVRRLGARKPKTGRVPVVYDPRAANSLIGHLASAVNGVAVARGTSFLKDRMGQRIFSAGIGIVDDPHRQRGLRSRPFDADGMANPRMSLIEDGVLMNWLLDLRTARQLGLASTGRAARGTSSPPSPSASNLYLEPGRETPAALMADIESGLYVTELIGMGVNTITGDYSRGAAGYWIENGQIAWPVSEITIAGNLGDMFLNLTPANDLKFRYGTDAPTIRVDGMTVAGA